jgi:hypothetical protein
MFNKLTPGPSEEVINGWRFAFKSSLPLDDRKTFRKTFCKLPPVSPVGLFIDWKNKGLAFLGISGLGSVSLNLSGCN